MKKNNIKVDKKYPQTKDFHELAEKLVGKEKAAELQKEAQREAAIVRASYKLKLKKQNSSVADLDDYFGKKELLSIKKEADHEAEILRAQYKLKKEAAEAKIIQSMHKFIKSSVDEYMQEYNVGFNELVKRLDLSPTYVSKMKKGQANLTIATFARVMATLGKDPFEVLKIKK